MTTLVTGATGNVGRHVVRELLGGGHRVRALTRDPARAELPHGVEAVAGDLAVPDGLGPALKGVTAVHLITFDGGDGAALRTGPQIARLAAEAGASQEAVDHVVGWYADPPEEAYTVSDTVERILGHPARTFAQWAQENAVAFR